MLLPVISLVYDPLINIDPDTNEYIPALAKQWVVTNNSMEWTLYLREDVVFHDGSRFNASIVKKTFERILNISNSDYIDIAPFTWIEIAEWNRINSCDILDEFIIRVNMKEPGSPFGKSFPSIALTLDNYFPINFTEELETFTPRGGKMIWPVGTGPYRLENVSIQDKYVNISFIRFDSHFRGIAPFEKIDYLFYPNPTDYEEAIASQAGELAERYISPVYYLLYNKDYWNLASRTGFTLVGNFNYQRAELRSPQVRLALNYALDRNNLVMKIFGLDNRGFIESDLQPANTVLPQTSIANDSKFGYPYNQMLAESLLNQAGYPRNADGYRFNLSITRMGFQGNVQDWLVSSFDSLGIRCTFNIIGAGETTPNTEKPDIMLIDAFFGYTQYDFLHSNGIQNFGGYSDEIMNKLTYLEKKTPVRQEKEFYEKNILQLSQEQAPYLLLLNGHLGYIKAKSIESLVSYSPYGFYNFNYSAIGGAGIRFSVNQQSLNYSFSEKLKTMENIVVKDRALYFPFTDNILQSTQELIVSTQKSTNINTFLPEFDLQGKFFKIEVNNQNVDYHLRCYYDPEDISTISRDQITLYKWNQEKDFWEELVPYYTNSSLRYVEVVVSGNIIVRFGLMDLRITFRFLPIFSILLLSMMVIISITLVYNQKTSNYLLRRYEE